MRASSTTPAAAAVATLLTALAYALVGWLALRVAIPPSYASPIYPSAGIALAATLVYGRWGAAGAMLGAFAVNAALGAERGQWGMTGLLIAVAVGIGAALQATAGRALLRRFVSGPLVLTEPADLARFYVLAGPVACLVNASLATGALTLAGVVEPHQWLTTWGTWWVGDTLGVMIAAPIVLTLIGEPRSEWAPRRAIVAVPLLLASLVLGLATVRVQKSYEERLSTAFERDAWGLAERVDAHLRGPQRALLAMHGLIDTYQRIDPEEMRRAAAPWLVDQPFLVAIGYSEKVPRAGVEAFEARVRAEGPAADFRVFDRPEAGPLEGDAEVLAIRYIEPLAPNRRALGVNQLSIPAAREAIGRVLAQGGIAATAGFRLTQSERDETGIVLYQPLLRGEPVDAAARREALTGLVFVTLRLDAMLADLFRAQPTYLRWCLVDADPAAVRPRLGGTAGCESVGAEVLHYERRLVIGGRPLVLRVDARPSSVPGLADNGVWVFSVFGLLAVTLLGALLLTVSGRQQRIEAAVAARTADLQRAGLALRENEERLRSIVDHVPIGIVYADTEGRVREANPSLLAMLGVMALPEPGPRLADWAHPLDRAAVQALLVDLAAGRQVPARKRVRLIGRGGQVLTVQLGLSALHDGEGQPRRLVGVVEDIGEHLRLEASERAREQAEAASRAKSEFVGRMSHELRTPLNAMLGFGQLLARDRNPALSEHQQRWAVQIQDAGWHLLNMINDTLDLSMIESGALRLSPRPLDVASLLEATLPLVTAAAERRGVRLARPRIAPDAATVQGDETRVKQILTNLLSNAVKYNVDGGRVEVDVRPLGPAQVEILVHDTGEGLTDQQLEGLFRPFNRLGREASGVEGTGIGLVISRRLAELMGGSLDASSSSAGGSTFVLRLPLPESIAQRPDAVAARPGQGDYRRRRVHYVEDNETNVVLMQGMLAQRPQIELTVSALGLDALVAIRAERPDLILLDMHLPDIDGMDLLRHLKQDDSTASIPVLVLSADATRDRTERAMAEGAAGYLTKPLNLAELLARVDELLERVDTQWG
jgi:PAS domain S-box-containing protein